MFMTVFTTQVTKLLTPRLKSLGFKKIGTFDRSPTHDAATYVRGKSEVKITLQLHPYDYPDHGIQIHVMSDSKIVVSRLYPIEQTGIEELIKKISSDVDSNNIPFE